MNDAAPPATWNPRSPGRRPGPGPRRHPGRRANRSLALLLLVVLAAAPAVAGCSNSPTESSSSSSKQQYASDAPGNRDAGAGRAADDATGPDAESGPGGQDSSAERKPPKIAPEHVVRKARLTVKVKDVPSALDDARTTVETAGGYIGDETTDRDGQSHERSHLVLRVPQEEYADVLEELSGNGKLIERKVSADDVTDKVVDVESRIASQKASVERVRDLMDKATELSDIVTLEGQLSTRQAELESLQAQQKSLKDRTALATITLVLSETEVEDKDDGTGFTDALKGGWEAFITTMRWVAVVIGAALPFLGALAVLLVLWRLVRDRLPQRVRPSARSAVLPAADAIGRPSPAPAPAPAPAKAPAPAPAPAPAKASERPSPGAADGPARESG